MDNINVDDLITNILNRANGIVDCLPFHLQENIREVIKCVSYFSIEHGINYDNENFFYYCKLKGENLYMCLNNISRDLGICNLLFPENVYLEDAAHNIGIIFSFMSNHGYEFDSCCNSGKRMIK